MLAALSPRSSWSAPTSVRAALASLRRSLSLCLAGCVGLLLESALFAPADPCSNSLEGVRHEASIDSYDCHHYGPEGYTDFTAILAPPLAIAHAGTIATHPRFEPLANDFLKRVLQRTRISSCRSSAAHPAVASSLRTATRARPMRRRAARIRARGSTRRRRRASGWCWRRRCWRRSTPAGNPPATGPSRTLSVRSLALPLRLPPAPGSGSDTVGVARTR